MKYAGINISAFVNSVNYIILSGSTSIYWLISNFTINEWDVLQQSKKKVIMQIINEYIKANKAISVGKTKSISTISWIHLPRIRSHSHYWGVQHSL